MKKKRRTGQSGGRGTVESFNEEMVYTKCNEGEDELDGQGNN